MLASRWQLSKNTKKPSN